MKIEKGFNPLYLLIIVFLVCTQPAFGQNGAISGNVIDKTGNPVANAHVIIGDNKYVDVTNTQGAFVFTNIEPGTYQLKVSSIGYHTYEQEVETSSGTTPTLTIQLESRRYESPTVVVTATRTRRDIEDTPEPVTVIKKEEIRNAGSTRLSEVLAEQTGLTLTSDHGTGVQVQGFTSDYTKILIDGQPLIGRTAGTLNLDRISVGNVKQVEMIKGPSSALWGSDALAGVINIITEEGDRPFELGVNSRYGSNQTVDLGVNVSANFNGWENNLFLNRNSSEGYSLVPNAISQTVPSYYNYTASYQTSAQLSSAVEFEFKGRYYHERQSSTDYLGDTNNPTMLDGNALQEDYSLAPSLQFNFGSGINAEINHYFSRYRTDTKFHYRQGDSLYDHSKFDQRFNKLEIRLNKAWSSSHISTAGSGYINEQLVGERYPSDPTFNSYFVYGQHEWMPSRKWDIIAGFRYDGHSEYQSQLSPKISAQYKISEWLHVRGSAGGGFKAPDFRQLFLDFTNPTVGYSVFGSSNAVQRIRELQERGQINQILIPLSQLQEIEAEQSWAYNAGLNLFPTDNLELRFNFFHNDVNNLIETAPVATKNNGQSIFTYFNLEEVYTRGIETQLRWQPLEQLELSAGYQLLDARRKIAGTRTVQDGDGEVIEETYSYYKPMFNRSKHTANIKAYYFWEQADIDANIRGNWYGKYGRVDTNGNGFVNSGEYQDGYTIWDAAVAKTFREQYTLRVGIDNMFDFTRPSGLSYLPGRIFYVQLSLQLY
ncbi:MAG: TonB-dependent receptor [Balneolaceae bacterium]|nr:TonB-dependent receptor [Balneolaceae bacterium]